MKTLKDFYEEKKKLAHLFPPMVYGLSKTKEVFEHARKSLISDISKPKYREPLDKEHQETLNKYVKQIYNPRLRKLKEAEHFREEWLEPETVEIKTQT